MAPVNAVFILLVGFVCSTVSAACVGCPKEQDPKNPSAHLFLKTTLTHYKAQAKGTDNELTTLLRVTKVTTQVVSGIRYTYEFEARGVKTHKLYTCRLVVLSQPWAEGDSIQEYQCQPLYLYGFQGTLIGAEMDIDVKSDHRIPELKEFIGKEISNQMSSDYLMGVVNFFKATEQIVEGVLIKAKVEVAQTDCHVGSANSMDNCAFQQQGHQVCTVEIWEKPWAQEKKMTLKDCNELPQVCKGCAIEVENDDTLLIQSLKMALSKFNSASQAKKFSLVHINKAYVQVVSGLKYFTEFEAEDETKSLFSCKAEFYVKPWLSKSGPVFLKLENFNCTPAARH